MNLGPNVPAITAAEMVEYQARTSPERNGEEGMTDALWRVANLYDITHPKRGLIPFRPNREQVAVLICVFIRRYRRILLPKSRQLGMSTLLMVVGMDACAFTEGYQAAIIDKTAPDAESKLAGKAKLAWQALERECPEAVAGVAFSPAVQQLTWTAGDVESTFKASVSVRGGTLNWLHISEWGEIQDKARHRSAEILSGGLPAVEQAGDDGMMIVETTWSCGLDGELGGLAREALETREDEKGPTSWRILFFGWIGREDCTAAVGRVDDESEKALQAIEARTGLTISKPQRLWFAQKRRELGSRRMRSQYPATLSDCLEATKEGSIYGDWIERAQSSGRTQVKLAVHGGVPVHTFWDLGAPLNTVCIYVQVVGREWRIIDADIDLDVTLGARVACMKAKGYNLGHHFIPHDGGQETTTGSDKAAFMAAGLPNIITVPRIPDVWDGIDETRQVFDDFVFRDCPEVNLALQRLRAYHFARENSGGITTDRPVHDINSHVADAFRQIGQARADRTGGRLISSAGIVGARKAHGPPVAAIRSKSRI
jgi:hypothetical protein